MGKFIGAKKYSETLIASLCTDGIYLWDKTRQMNLSIRAQSEEAAFLDALRYYQNRLLEVEKAHKELRTKVNSFLVQFEENSD